MNNSIIRLDLEQMAELLPDYLLKERNTALHDIMAGCHFQPLNDNSGPYGISLSIEDGRLVLRMRNAQQAELPALALSLSPYRRLIQDYFLMIESYEAARQHATREKLEAIDMGRRGLHNEGAELLKKRLADKIDIDFETARKFFTLLCVLHKTHMKLVG